MDNPRDKVILPTDEELNAARKAATNQFTRESLRQAHRQRFANRYHVQIGDDGKGFLSIGSTGLVAVAEEGSKVEPEPVAFVHAVYAIDVVFLRELLKTLQEILPPEIDPVSGAGDE